jgi:hypothetical protein
MCCYFVQATSATLSYPHLLHGDTDGNLFIADSSNCRVRLVSTSTGIIARFAGTGAYSYTGDGGQVILLIVSPHLLLNKLTNDFKVNQQLNLSAFQFNKIFESKIISTNEIQSF